MIQDGAAEFKTGAVVPKVREPVRGAALPADGVETQRGENEIMICSDKRETRTRCQEGTQPS